MATHPVKTLAEFDGELAAVHLFGQWNADAAISRFTDGPPPGGEACLWKWETVRAKLREACDVFPDSLRARRNLTFVNPGLPRRGSTQTLIMGMQLVMPGEVAWAHRHTIGALRFTVEGDARLSTVVEGERLPMETNDLVLTPSWTWHDHHNESDHDGIWLDVLDVPLIMGLNQTFYEPFGESVQPEHARAADALSERGRIVRPTWEEPPRRSLPFRYAWRDVEPILRTYADAEGSPFDGVRLSYANPVTGGPTLPTMACSVQLLRPGLVTQSHRHTASAVYYVVRGSGTTVVEGRELAWSERDAFVVPNWARHAHANASATEDAILFSVTDEPLLEALGLYREDPQEVRRAPFPALQRSAAR